ncbi:MAG: 1-deoxy-D-xylulose-5-phosphate synthase [Peptococcaceae bacterium]|jgi:1-deoxy-D-xylulose-5-phosphate synthase|nr:1-deoxy-D-xylulose-5-phosphate synthase [Peptococcaceae bacterium]MBQ5615864.1 1-deoxy-D-xylulose-5-phosphate synthase [Peptococcaceae bacterium]MBQ5659371.1 1-deoxy-D-xylulose-5-phosphate synthase [Peptococcaceae bacterium]MBR0448132.1 1-deoxy-D-xylulose-5-phosphate synthase [Peptococcaceae bacterium]
MQYLQQIKSPDDIKTMNMSELKVLAQEIRETLIQVVSENGGHLAPNLGVVELTLALHMVFHTPEDKIIWDVGHQSYVHKLLTGRYEQFHTVRTLDGLSGFPKRSESEHDAFGAGHSSTSISAAVGFAKARDLRGGKNNVIAVIGDGAMTGGMAFEALENAGHMDSNIIVILNDNEMSIDPNVGALAEYLSRARSNPAYTKSKDDVEELLKKIPGIGDKMFKAADKLKDSLKYLLVPGVLFEEFGFKYYGPINGHDLPALMTVLENVKGINRPVLIHVETKKGKGYAPAEKNPDLFHGVSPFHIQTGELKKKSTVPTYTSVFGKTLAELGAQDDRIVGITAAMGKGTGINVFQEQFPARTIDVGIAEEHAVTMAAAMALDGYKPVVAIYSTFLQRAYDQVMHDVALQNAPVVFCLDRAGLVGDDGPTHHGIFDVSYLRHIPNMVCMAPKDENELRHMLNSALTYNCPVAMRYPRGEGLGVPMDEALQVLPLGKAEVLQEGDKVTLLALGSMVHIAELAAERLQAELGITPTVINARFAKPLDADTILQYAGQDTLLVTLEEQAVTGGFGSAVLELYNQHGIDARNVLTIGIADSFVQHGNTARLKEMQGLDVESVVAKVKERLG